MSTYLEQLTGVKSVVSGFMGGKLKNPSYKEVVYKNTGHVETVEVIYDSKKITYTQIAKYFFEIHDFTQTDGQGPDLGDQYLSVLFYNSVDEKKSAYQLVNILTQKGYKVATTISKSNTFYRAEKYHQNYYKRHNKTPYCHLYKKIF